jgi:glycosyltransferase involved in cell wall biosynthesis
MKNYVLHICPDYRYVSTNIYHYFFSALEKCSIENIVYVSNKKAEIPDVSSYKIYSFHRKFNIIERIIYFYKQKLIYDDISRRIELSEIKLIHAHKLFSAGYIAYKIYKKTGIPYIVAVRNTDVNYFFKYMLHLRRIGLNIIKDARYVVFISYAYKEFVLSKYVPGELKNIIAKKTVVIPNGIDKCFLNDVCRKMNKNKYNAIKILSIGDINKNKNFITMIKACYELQRMGYKVEYTIIGRKEDIGLYKDIIKNKFVVYHPPCSKEKLLNKMRNADIFAMPSITETFGTVYPEAMSQGLPVIYSKGQGFDGYFKDGEVGFSVDCFDYIAIANKVVEILNDYDNISNRCNQNVYRFDWDKIGLEYESIYNELVR